MFLIRLDFVISLLIVTAVVSVKGSFSSLAVKESMRVHSEGPASHVLKVDPYCVTYFSFDDWTQKAKVWWMWFLLTKFFISELPIQHLFVLGGQPLDSPLSKRYYVAAEEEFVWFTKLVHVAMHFKREIL